MTTHSPDQSLSQSKSDTPITDRAEGTMTEIATGITGKAVFSSVARSLERELRALSQSPAPSKEMEERLKAIAIKYEARDRNEGKLYYQTAVFEVAAEIGKEREVLENDTLGYINEITTLKRELAEANLEIRRLKGA